MSDGAGRPASVQSGTDLGTGDTKMNKVAGKTLSALAWPEVVAKLRLRRAPASGGSPVSHPITEPGKVPSPALWRLPAEPKEDERLLSPWRADAGGTRAPEPVNLSCQSPLQGDEATPSGGGGERLASPGELSFSLRGGERQTGRFCGPFRLTS